MKFSNLALTLALAAEAIATPLTTTPLVKRAGLKGKSLKVLPLGDSITYGIGSTTGNGYRLDLLNDLTNAGAEIDLVGSVQAGSMADNDNDGYPGYKIADIFTAVQKTYFSGTVPDVVLLHAGSNDAFQMDDVGNMATRLGQLIDELTGGWPNAQVVVAKPIGTTVQCAEGVLVIYNLQIDGIVQQRVAQGKKVSIVDMAPVVNLLTELTDGVHPTDAGYTKMASKWFESINALAVAGKI